MRTIRALTFCAAAVLLSSCGEEDKSGACPGTMDGTYYRLRILNTTESGLDVRINGRFIGKVPGGTRSANGLVAGDARLGEFPICDGAVLDAKGGEGIESTRICTNATLLSPQCVNARVDYCWFSMVVIDGDELPGDLLPPADVDPVCFTDASHPCAAGFQQC